MRSRDVWVVEGQERGTAEWYVYSVHCSRSEAVSNAKAAQRTFGHNEVFKIIRYAPLEQP